MLYFYMKTNIKYDLSPQNILYNYHQQNEKCPKNSFMTVNPPLDSRAQFRPWLPSDSN
jgi:hypothetical protein